MARREKFGTHISENCEIIAIKQKTPQLYPLTSLGPDATTEEEEVVPLNHPIM